MNRQIKIASLSLGSVAMLFYATALSALSMVLPGSAGSYTVNVTSFKEARFSTVLKQRYDYSCGSAALASLLTYHYEHPLSEQSVFTKMYENGNREKIRSQGFSLLDMKRFLQTLGYRADGYRASLDKLAKAGVPAITLINNKGYKHFVVVKGVSPSDVLMGDPSQGIKVLPRSQFESLWNKGILFVIHGKRDTARRHFNDEKEWRVVANAPLGIALSRSSLADTNLLLPARSDF